jgi:hypothetical protein
VPIGAAWRGERFRDHPISVKGCIDVLALTRPEAIAHAAEAAAEALPAPTTDRQRVVFGRIQSLATKTSEQASASLHFANSQVVALTAQIEARRKAADR